MHDDALLRSKPDTFATHWVRWTVLLWLLVSCALIAMRWKWINTLMLPDTDDNMRLMQVRGLLNGQAWFDLRQYALSPPAGANIHWSRLVDLPIAALILLFRPFVGGDIAERIAAAMAPLLPFLVMLISMAVVVRRLIAPYAYLLAIFLSCCAFVTMGMFMPMRIDHHGWQLAFLVMTLAGMADEHRLRGGVIVGLASAASLTIGLEMIAYLALAGAAVVLRWVAEPQEATRMRAYGGSLVLGCAAGYYGFASYDNAKYMCDALSPVWLSMMVAAGSAALAMSFLSLPAWVGRLGVAAVVGAMILGGFIHFWPDCLGRPEHVSAVVDRIWLSNVREAKPIYTQDLLSASGTIALPIAGSIGTLLALWRARGSPKFAIWAMITLFTLAAFALLVWQVRAGPAAELIAIPGAVALAWVLIPLIHRSPSAVVRVLGTLLAFLFISGIGALASASLWIELTKPKPIVTKGSLKAKPTAIVNRSGLCLTLPKMAELNALPATMMFTHVDLGPRLITLTHHHTIAGPYHRNGDQILDVYMAFAGTDDHMRETMLKYHATQLLTCPGLSETTVYRARWPHGFYARLEAGKTPQWLVPVPLPKDSPFRLWAVKATATQGTPIT